MKTKEQLEACCPIGADLTSYIHGYIEGYTDRECENEPDWSAFRREAAKDILPSVIEKASEIYEFESLVKDVWCKQAVEWADELIKQLKQE